MSRLVSAVRVLAGSPCSCRTQAPRHVLARGISALKSCGHTVPSVTSAGGPFFQCKRVVSHGTPRSPADAHISRPCTVCGCHRKHSHTPFSSGNGPSGPPMKGDGGGWGGDGGRDIVVSASAVVASTSRSFNEDVVLLDVGGVSLLYISFRAV